MWILGLKGLTFCPLVTSVRCSTVFKFKTVTNQDTQLITKTLSLVVTFANSFGNLTELRQRQVRETTVTNEI